MVMMFVGGVVLMLDISLVLVGLLLLLLIVVFWRALLVSFPLMVLLCTLGTFSCMFTVTNHKSQITNHKSQIANRKSQITYHKSQITNHKFMIVS